MIHRFNRLLPLGLLFAGSAFGAGVSHHGGPILHCDPPQFFDESPVKDSKVASFKDFSVVASDNTDGPTIKLWVNNEPVDFKLTEQRSGRLLIEASLKAPITTGRAWIRVTGDSKDGCDNFYVWNVYLKQ